MKAYYTTNRNPSVISIHNKITLNQNDIMTIASDYKDAIEKLLFSENEFFLCEVLIENESVPNYLLNRFPIKVEVTNFSKITNKPQDIYNT